VTKEDVDDPRNFLFATADGLEAASSGIGGEVAREPAKRATGGFVSQIFTDHAFFPSSSGREAPEGSTVPVR
jgi:hypothetical protein